MKEFVAITDEMFYGHPEMYDRLVPFSHEVNCRHLMQQPLDMADYGNLIEFTIEAANDQGDSLCTH